MEFIRKNSHILLLFLAAVALYANTLQHDYAYDDAIVITGNSRVLQGLESLPDLFKNIRDDSVDGRYGYRPIVLLTFALEVELFGLNPFWGHLNNVMLYGLLIVLIYRFIRKLFPDIKDLSILSICLLFVVHPMHTEVVANIKSRDEILAMIFGFGFLMQFSSYLNTGKLFRLLAALPLLVLAFLSKESAITFAGVACTIPFLQPQKTWSTKLRQLLPILGFLVAILALWKFSQSEAVLIANDDLVDRGEYYEEGKLGNPLFFLVDDYWSLLANSFHLLIYYGGMFLIPWPMKHDYSYNTVHLADWSIPHIWISVALHLFLLWKSIRLLQKNDARGFAILFYLITISIYLHFIQKGTDLISERFLFAPSLGLCMLVVLQWNWLMGKMRILRHIPPRYIFLTLFVIMAVMTVSRNADWKDTRTLLESDLPRLGECARANYNYANVLHQDYYGLEQEFQPEAQQQILYHYKKSTQISDRLLKGLLDLGSAYMEFGYPDSAYKVFQYATKRYSYLAPPFFQMGKYHISLHEYGKAIPHFEKAIENGRKNSNAYYFLAVCMIKVSRNGDALQVLQKGLSFSPDFAEYYSLIGRLYIDNGIHNQAVEALKTAQKLDPNNQEVNLLLNSLGF